MQDVAVIGGGWAGLAASVHLAAAGMRPWLYEAGRELGGRARRAARLGDDLDNGQHILLGAYRDCLALMRQVGAEPERLFRRLPFEVRDNQGFRLALPRLPPPLDLAWGLLAARGPTWSEKRRAAFWLNRLRRTGFRLAHDQTVAAWLREAGQSGILCRQLWEPLCLAALNTPAEIASARVFAQVLHDSLGSDAAGATDLLLPRQSLSALLPEPAALWLARQGARIHTGCRVRPLPVEGGWQVGDRRFCRVVLAVAPWHLATLLPATPALPYPSASVPIATLYLHYPAKIALPFPLMALHGGFGQWLVDRGGGILAASFSGEGAWTAASGAQLAEALHAEIAGIVPVGDLPRWQFVRERRATFACTPDLVRAPQKTPWPGLFLAGDHTWAAYPATLEGAVRSGLAAARLCLEADGSAC
jgi:squalene-associated FAD-dependent desaturase